MPVVVGRRTSLPSKWRPPARAAQTRFHTREAGAAPPAPAAASPPSCADVDAAEAAPADTSGVEVTCEVSREDIERRKRKLAIDVDALELDPVKVEVKEEAR